MALFFYKILRQIALPQTFEFIVPECFYLLRIGINPGLFLLYAKWQIF